MLDYTGRAIDELRDAIETWPVEYQGYEVRGKEIQPEDTLRRGSAPLLITVGRTHPIRRRRAPLATYGFTITIYHPDPRKCTEVTSLVSDAFHDRGPRVVVAGGQKIGAYISADVGGSVGQEPDTKWPFERVVVNVIAPTVAIT
jgi:hypothetical protein